MDECFVLGTGGKGGPETVELRGVAVIDFRYYAGSSSVSISSQSFEVAPAPLKLATVSCSGATCNGEMGPGGAIPITVSATGTFKGIVTLGGDGKTIALVQTGGDTRINDTKSLEFHILGTYA